MRWTKLWLATAGSLALALVLWTALREGDEPRSATSLPEPAADGDMEPARGLARLAAPEEAAVRVPALPGALVAGGPYGVVRGHVVPPPARDPWKLRALLVDATGSCVAGACVDARGRFELAVAPAGRDLRLQVTQTAALVRADAGRGEPFRPARATPRSFVRAELAGLELRAGETREVALELEPLATLGGALVDERGHGLEGLLLYAHETSIDGPVLLHSARARRHGLFRFDALPAGELALEVQRPSGSRAPLRVVELSPGERRTDLRLTLLAGAELSGVVLLPDGSPAAGARVGLLQAASRSSAGARPQPITTDEQGRFRFEELAQAPCTLGAVMEGPLVLIDSVRRERQVALLDDVHPDDGSVTLRLDRGLALSGRVRDDLGAPVQQVSLYVLPAGRLRGFELFESRTHRLETDEGRFELTGLCPGEWVFSLHTDEHAPLVRRPVRLPLDAPLDLRLERLARVSGRVLTPDGAPAERALVTASCDDPTCRDSRRAITRAEGRFTRLLLPSGEHALVAELEGYAPSRPHLVTLANGEELEDVELVLRAGARLEVHVTYADGSARPGCAVVLRGPDGLRRAGTTGARGVARFELLPPGRYLATTGSLGGAAKIELEEGDLARIEL